MLIVELHGYLLGVPRVVSSVCCIVFVFFPSRGLRFLGLNGRDARLYIQRVSLLRCQVSALRCSGLGPLVDALGRSSRVLAYVNVESVTVCGVVCLSRCIMYV